MKRKIVLVRHGESADKQPGQRDFDRVLTERGEFSIIELAKQLMKENFSITKLISSSAVRAKQTVSLIASQFDFDQDEIEMDEALFNGTDQDYIDALHREPSLIVGHNPAISFVLGKISSDFSLSLSPGQAAILESENDKGDDMRFRLVKLLGPFTNKDVAK